MSEHTLPIENCELSLECPRHLANLSATADAKIRYCDHCKNNVYQCESFEELKRRTEAGQCVALSFSPCRPDNTEVGDVVRVTSGHFLNFDATVEKLDSTGSKAEVLYHVFGRAMPTWVPLNEFGHVQETSQQAKESSPEE